MRERVTLLRIGVATANARGKQAMNAHRVETLLTEDGSLTLRNLPFKSGTALEIIILERDPEEAKESGETEHVAEWLNASKRSLQGVWDNDEDAIYDNIPSEGKRHGRADQRHVKAR